jgi:carboxymethylenebutenolidase
VGERVDYPSNGESAQGYLALPQTGEQGPGVVVIQEWWGLVPHIEDVAERFAAEGFVALAPDLYHGTMAREPDEAQKQLMALDMARAARDIAGAAAYLRGLDETSGTGIGVVGYCMGGALALWSATVSDDVTAAVGFYPGLPWDQLSPDWSRYAGKAAMIHAAEGDGGAAAPHIATAREAITSAGGDASAFDYPGTQHAFFNDDRPEVHHAEASRQAWSRTVDFLRQHLS